MPSCHQARENACYLYRKPSAGEAKKQVMLKDDDSYKANASGGVVALKPDNCGKGMVELSKCALTTATSNRDLGRSQN